MIQRYKVLEKGFPAGVLMPVAYPRIPANTPNVHKVQLQLLQLKMSGIDMLYRDKSDSAAKGWARKN